jgi:molybdopterin-guanine dinucleotide biosynthesis protein A
MVEFGSLLRPAPIRLMAWRMTGTINDPANYPATLGVILAGGLSRRMGGGDKGLTELAGRAILARVVERLAQQTTSLILNANGDPARFGGIGLAVVADAVPGHPGPLAGVLAGLDAALRAVPPYDWLLAVPCDLPFLPADLLAGLHQARLRAGAAGAVAASAARRHSAVALWPVACRGEIERALLAEGVRRVDTLIERFGFAEAEWQATPFDPFANINDPAGLEAAAALLERWPQA